MNENCELCNNSDSVWFGFCFIPCWECKVKNRRCNSVSMINQNTHPPHYQ